MSNPKTHRPDFIPVNNKDEFLGNKTIDQLMSVVISMGSELWAVQRRLLTIESILDQKGSVTRESLEKFVPSTQEAAAWEVLRDRYIKRVYGFLDEQSADADLTNQNSSGAKQ